MKPFLDQFLRSPDLALDNERNLKERRRSPIGKGSYFFNYPFILDVKIRGEFDKNDTNSRENYSIILIL